MVNADVIDDAEASAPGVFVTRIGLSEATGGHPIDAVPSSDGSIFYFLGTDTQGTGVFSIPSTGGTPTRLCPAGLLPAPTGIDISNKDSLYIADRSFAGNGMVRVLPANGGYPIGVVSGYEPGGVFVLDDGELVFTGMDAKSGSPCVFRTWGGGLATIVSAGAPLSIWESGLTSVGQDLWVADLESPDVGKLIRISAMVGTTPFPLHPHVGSPAGIASKRDGSALLVSTLLNGSDALLEVDLPSGDTRSWTSGVSTTDSAPAGLHRAKGADIFAWCDRGAASDPGALYRVEWH